MWKLNNLPPLKGEVPPGAAVAARRRQAADAIFRAGAETFRSHQRAFLSGLFLEKAAFFILYPAVKSICG